MASSTTGKVSSTGEPGNLVVEAWRRATGWWRSWEHTGERVAAWEMASYGGLLLTALAMRLWDLGSRAMHHDESLHALYSYNLATGSGYRHDPMMHGPLQMEATAGIFFVFGDGEFAARLLYAVAGTILVALPFFLRSRLGRLGAVFVSVMLAFSPAMLYFSRFSRNDILMAVWTLGLIIAMWRYLDERRIRYLYLASGMLALSFATKESAYIITFILGTYLFIVLAAWRWPSIRVGVDIGQISPPAAIGRLAAGAWAAGLGALRESRVSGNGVFLGLLFTLSLPMGAALVSLFQDSPLLSWSNLVLATPVGGGNAIGAPTGGGLVVATVIVGLLIWTGAVLGSKWLGPVWWICAGIFYAVMVLMYTTFFTNIVGIGSGMWRSLGYWLAQQGVARGDQPIYYYLIITPLYEFLPLIFGIAGGIYYLGRRDRFGQFLVFWALATFVLYTYLSEKMPWLLVNLTLPLILISGKFLADMVKGIEWRRVVSGGGLLLVPGVPAFLLAVWFLAYIEVNWSQSIDVLQLALWAVVAIGLTFTGAMLAGRLGNRAFWSFAALPLAVMLLVLTVWTAGRASYVNGDIPVEMIVYTQTSPALARLAGSIEQVGEDKELGKAIPVLIDQTSGFSWPWAWYLREYTRTGYIDYSNPPDSAPDESVLVVHANNKPADDGVLADSFSPGIRIPHRRWFPENYRGLTVRKFVRGLFDRDAWRSSMDYILLRKLDAPLGSEDVYVYFSTDSPSDFAASPP